MKDFVGDMNACKSDECYRNTWTAKYGDTTYDQLSQDNLKDALETVGPIRAKDLLEQIQAGLSALGGLQCPTSTCDSYKFTLVDRALTARATLEHTYQEGTGILLSGLIAPVGAVAGAVREAAVATEARGAEKAYAYRLEVKGSKEISTVVEPKIAQQMGKRGWTTDSLENVISNPSKTVVTKDTRFDPASGTRLNAPATGYIAKDGSYVVRNDRTGAVVQVSDKNDKNWVAPWD